MLVCSTHKDTNLTALGVASSCRMSRSLTTCSAACRNTHQLMQLATVSPLACQKCPVKMELAPDSDRSGTRYACTHVRGQHSPLCWVEGLGVDDLGLNPHCVYVCAATVDSKHHTQPGLAGKYRTSGRDCSRVPQELWRAGIQRRKQRTHACAPTSRDIQHSRMACTMYTRLKATATAPMLRVSTNDFLWSVRSARQQTAAAHQMHNRGGRSLHTPARSL